MTKSLFDTKETVLENGVSVIIIKKDTTLASINIGVNIGALYEGKTEKGICHFIEHMMFKGTKKRSNEELNSELEEIGGEYNAYTEYNSTVYTITALCEELENSIEIISDMLQNSDFPDEEIEKERAVIISELRSGNDDIEELSYKLTNEAAFKKSPLRCEIIGDERSVNGFTRKKLISFYKKFYVPNNLYISVVSPFDHDDVIKYINSCFGKWERVDFIRPTVLIEKNINKTKKAYKKDVEQGSIIYLYTFYNLNRDEELALKILEHKLGSSTNSILFREIREKRGLAYEVYTDLNTAKNIKTIYIYISVSKEKIKETLKVIDETIEKIVNREIIFDDRTISLMKKILKTAVASTLEDSTDIGNYVLHQKIDSEPIYQFLDDMENINNIKGEDLYNVAEKVFKDPTVHILIPSES